MQEQKLFEAALRRDQAEAQVRRLKETIRVFFADESAECAHGSTTSPLGITKTRKISDGREEELLTTINGLRHALERSQQSIPLVKHRQVVGKTTAHPSCRIIVAFSFAFPA